MYFRLNLTDRRGCIAWLEIEANMISSSTTPYKRCTRISNHQPTKNQPKTNVKGSVTARHPSQGICLCPFFRPVLHKHTGEIPPYLQHSSNPTRKTTIGRC